MAGDSRKLQPIIVKRVKKAAHGHHGGAWKIAYADFVTAMMAFFLLMWLLGSTTEGDKKGIADYFNSPLRVSLMGGSGSGDATHVIKGGGTDLSRATGQTRKGDGEQRRQAASLQTWKQQQAAAEKQRLTELKAEIEQALVSMPQLAAYRSQIRVDMTRDGLRIQIVDDQGRPMFASGSAVLQPYMRDLLRSLGPLLAEVPNKITLEGHTDASPFAGGQAGYSNWELSADRANASRRELVAAGLDDAKVIRVQGLAASVPFDNADPLAAVNRRISIIVMTREAQDAMYRTIDTDSPEGVSEAASAVSAAPMAGVAAVLASASSPALVGR